MGAGEGSAGRLPGRCSASSRGLAFRTTWPTKRTLPEEPSLSAGGLSARASELLSQVRRGAHQPPEEGSINILPVGSEPRMFQTAPLRRSDRRHATPTWKKTLDVSEKICSFLSSTQQSSFQPQLSATTTSDLSSKCLTCYNHLSVDET